MTVFANNLEVSCKKQSNKVIAAFPDVCFTPPQAPPTPPGVPIPYPSFGMDSDTDKGTGTVKIGGETINLKNNSHFTKTTGTEAGSASKKGIISSKNTGKAKSQAYSMNVKAESKNICRFSDIETNNHGSPPNAPPWPKISKPNMPGGVDPCEQNKKDEEEACEPCAAECGTCAKCDPCKAAGLSTGGKVDNKTRASDKTLVFDGAGGAEVKRKKAARLLKSNESRINQERMKDYGAAQNNACLRARRCKLMSKKDADAGGCCGKQTGHHMVPESGFCTSDGAPLAGCSGYDAEEALCICAEGASHNKGSHGLMHNDMYCEILDKTGPAGEGVMSSLSTSTAGGRKKRSVSCRSMTYGQMRDKAVSSVEKIFPGSKCSPACLKAQLDTFHQGAGVKEDTKLRADPIPGRPPEEARRTMDNIEAINAWARANG